MATDAKHDPIKLLARVPAEKEDAERRQVPKEGGRKKMLLSVGAQIFLRERGRQ